MLKNILNLEGVALLSKEEQKNVNGGLKCVTLSYEEDITASGYVGNGYATGICTFKCRPSFLGIGFGSWGEVQSGPCNG